MPEARLTRFRGVAYNLPEIRSSEYAVDARNVYEKQLGSLTRREGTRRAIEYQDGAPILLAIPLPEPGGEYTGVGLDFLIQGEAIVGKTGPEKTFATDYALPTITGVSFGNFRSGWRVVIYVDGTNFDSWPERKISASIENVTRGNPLIIQVANYVNPNHMNFSVRLQDVADLAPATETVRVVVQNPNGLSASWQGVMPRFAYR